MCCVLALRLHVFMHALSGTLREDSGHLPWTFLLQHEFSSAWFNFSLLVHHSPAKEPVHLNAFPEHSSSLNYLRPKRQRPQMLNLSGTEMSGVLRPRPAGLDSPSSNRYAGDWSSCGENYFLNPRDCLGEADYDDVPSEDTESGDDSSKAEELDAPAGHPQPDPGEHSFGSYLTVPAIDSAVDHRAHLKDLQESIDTLIGNLERELNKNKLNMSC